jgi:hypothetical protein
MSTKAVDNFVENACLTSKRPKYDAGFQELLK